ncbi:MAG: porin [Pikeienuella sp.]
MKPAAALIGLAVMLPASAGAGEIETSLRGYFNVGGGVADPEGTDDQFGLFRDGEIHFRAIGVMDNGLTFTARAELEAFSSGDQIDENWVAIGGAFGNLLFGGADSALNEHGGVGVVYPSGDYFNYYDGTGSVVPGDPGSMVGKDDAIGVRYWYEAGGFEVGASYQPDSGADGGADSNNFVFEADNQYAVGASYDQKFGDFGFAVGGGYLWNDDAEMGHVGLEFSFGGFTLAGFHDRETYDFGAPDLHRYGIGAEYRTGPWSFGGGYTLTDRKDGRGDDDFIQIGGGYALAPGVTAYGAAQWGENERDIDGYGVFSWLNVNF